MPVFFLVLLFVMTSCQSTGGGHVQVSNSYPGANCKEVGQVIGSSNSSEDTYNKSLADLRHSADSIGGNYVRVIARAAHGSAIRGMAYSCR